MWAPYLLHQANLLPSLRELGETTEWVGFASSQSSNRIRSRCVQEAHRQMPTNHTSNSLLSDDEREITQQTNEQSERDEHLEYGRIRYRLIVITRT